MKSNRQSALAGLLQGRIDESVKKGTSLPPLELGTIDGNMNLLVDGLPGALKSYMVCRQLTLGPTNDVLTKTKKDGEHLVAIDGLDFQMNTVGKNEKGIYFREGNDVSLNGSIDGSSHVHEVLIPEKMRYLRPGDRVLVAWASNIPVVIDIVYDKSEMG